METSNHNINIQSDNEDEKYDKQIKENETKISQEQELNEIPDKNSAFQIYKMESQQAREIQSGILQNQDDLRIKKTEAKEFLERCNAFKAKIEEYKIILNEKKLNKLSLGDDMTNIIDEEEFKVIDSFKGVKESYKEYLEKFKTAKSDISVIKNNLDLLKVRYVDNFETWFFKRYGIKLEDHELRMSKVIITFYYIHNFKSKYGIVENENLLMQVDPEEQAYFKAKKKVQTLHKAKKLDKKK